MATVTESLLTAEEYARLADNDRPSELVRGRVVRLNWRGTTYGQISGNIQFIFGSFGDSAKCGHFLARSSVVTEWNPDTVRGADLAFYSYSQVPKGPLPWNYLPVPPEIVVDVKSLDDRWGNVQLKVGEYLNVGVKVVCVLDDEPPTLYLYTADQPVRILEAEDELELPDVLPGFRVTVRRFFE